MERRLGRGSATLLVAGNMIGTGVFTTSGYALAELGSPGRVLAAWGIGGAIALCGAVSYGALARVFAENGGEYALLRRTVHPLAGFLAGWVSLLAGFTAPIAAAALAFETYLTAGLGADAGSDVLRGWAGAAAIVGCAALHGVRLGPGVIAQNLAIGLKLLAVVALIVLGSAHLLRRDAAPAETLAPTDPLAFATTLIWISYAFSGWNAAVYVAGEMRRPERDLLPAQATATLGVFALYLGLNAVFVYAAPMAELAGRAEIGAAAAEVIGGPALRRAVAALIAMALLTSISSMLMTGPRVVQRMAQDGLLPRVLAPGRDVPAAAVVALGAASLVVLRSAELAALLGYLGLLLGLSTAASVGGLMLLRRRLGAACVPVPAYPWIPLLFVLATLASSALLAVREPMQAVAALVTTAAGVPVYFWIRSAPRARSDGGSEHAPRAVPNCMGRLTRDTGRRSVRRAPPSSPA